MASSTTTLLRVSIEWPVDLNFGRTVFLMHCSLLVCRRDLNSHFEAYCWLDDPARWLLLKQERHGADN